MSKHPSNSLLAGEQRGSTYSLVLPRSAMSGAGGRRTAASPGSSLEFRDFRDYQPGDDLRRIDWGAYARSDRLAVRIYHDEVSPHADIIVDGSRSMALEGTAKPEAARFLAAFFAAASMNAGCAHKAWICADGFHEIPGGTGRPAAWGSIEFHDASAPEDAFHALPPRWRRNGIRIILSDLLWLGDPLALLQMLGDGAAAVIVVQLLAEADRSPGARGNVSLVDAETGEEKRIFVDAVAERRYREALEAHQQNWFRACRQMGASFVPLTAEPIMNGAGLDALAAAHVVEVL